MDYLLNANIVGGDANIRRELHRAGIRCGGESSHALSVPSLIRPACSDTKAWVLHEIPYGVSHGSDKRRSEDITEKNGECFQKKLAKSHGFRPIGQLLYLRCS